MLILYRLLQQLDLSINPCIAFRRPVTILGEKAGTHTYPHTQHPEENATYILY